jgi:3-phenylpropionate/trans-cinnamate dioxygenase ferredoxin reductase subunit
MQDGRISTALGRRIKTGHRVRLTGPYGSAHYRPNPRTRLILAATNTGFAPIWSIAAAALRENPERKMMIIAGGRTMEALYMGPALRRLAQFRNVLIVPVCSGDRMMPAGVMPGRPTDYLPHLLPSDVVYACGAPGMVEAVKSIAADTGATCYADPFLPTIDNSVQSSVLARAAGCLARSARHLTRPNDFEKLRERHEPSLARLESVEAGMRSLCGPQSA